MKNILILILIFSPTVFAGGGGGGGGLPFNNEVLSSDVQSDGKLVSGGKFTGNRIKRLNTDTDSSVDASFEASWALSGFNNDVNTLKVLPNDNIIVGGKFTSFDTSLAGFIALIKSDGQFDASFAANTGTGFDGEVKSIDVQTDGSFIVAGEFTDFNGTSVGRLVRLFSNGLLDTSFNPESFNGPINKVFVDSFNQCLVGGDFTKHGLKDRFGFEQLLANGQEDSFFFGQVE